jgi:hypothetical protein
MVNLNDLIDADSGWVITAAADINDAAQIAATARSPEGTTRALLLNPGLCPADYNADRTLDSQDFFEFVTSLFAGAADFNLDRVTNSQDCFDFLSGFFAGCA